MGFSPPEKISLGGPALPPTTNYDKMWSITRQYGKPSSLPLILFFPFKFRVRHVFAKLLVYWSREMF